MKTKHDDMEALCQQLTQLLADRGRAWDHLQEAETARNRYLGRLKSRFWAVPIIVEQTWLPVSFSTQYERRTNLDWLEEVPVFAVPQDAKVWPKWSATARNKVREAEEAEKTYRALSQESQALQDLYDEAMQKQDPGEAIAQARTALEAFLPMLEALEQDLAPLRDYLEQASASSYYHEVPGLVASAPAGRILKALKSTRYASVLELLTQAV